MRRHLLWKILLGLGLAAVFACALMVAQVQWNQADKIFTKAEEVKPAPYAIVLGASVNKDGTPSWALEDRVLTAVDLYKQGKVKKLLMTGDDGRFRDREIPAMKNVALNQGVSSTDILLDPHGYRTYESCKNASTVFGITQAIVVTQRFHLGRALYLCAKEGIAVQGLTADRRSYANVFVFTLRDLLASVKAWWDINIWAPQPPVKY